MKKFIQRIVQRTCGREVSGMKRIFINMFALLLLVFLTTIDVVNAGGNFVTPMLEPIACNYEFAAFPSRLKEYELYPWELLKNKDFRTAYYKILGTKNDKWLRLKGPGIMSKHVVINQQSFVMTDSCKTHECGEFNIVILYEPDRKISYGLLREDGKLSFLGEPSACYQQALQNLELGNKAH